MSTDLGPENRFWEYLCVYLRSSGRNMLKIFFKFGRPTKFTGFNKFDISVGQNNQKIINNLITFLGVLPKHIDTKE